MQCNLAFISSSFEQDQRDLQGAAPHGEESRGIEWTDYYLADALIVSGKMTGDAPDLDKVRRAKEVSRGRPILLGSGTSTDINSRAWWLPTMQR